MWTQERPLCLVRGHVCSENKHHNSTPTKYTLSAKVLEEMMRIKDGGEDISLPEFETKNGEDDNLDGPSIVSIIGRSSDRPRITDIRKAIELAEYVDLKFRQLFILYALEPFHFQQHLGIFSQLI
ncbi:hypothetical protein L484_008238 [Morus notabilis]|uniref:Uncharacterized protein n=1 Tax=Morus notabilis TaxID=981085 RepID=W9QYP5_9ROSA|nr:hypothetical protein L484_008238 [Morus notabilis]